MKKLLFLIFICFILGFAGCSKEAPKATVYTSLYPLEQFTKWIIPEAHIEGLIPQGIDPHNFEPSLKDIQKLYNAKMVVYLGDTDVDRWIDKIKSELIQKGVKVVRLQDYIHFEKYSSGSEIDPHVWLDPVMVLEIIKVIKDKAQESFGRKDEYEKNFLLYKAKLEELNAEYQTLSKCGIKEVIATHEFLNYLSKRYGFKSHFIVHEPEDEPSLKKIKELKELMKKKSIEYIVSEPEGERIARALAEETGAKILKFNTFHTATGKDYFQAMKENLQILKLALKCS